MTYLLTFLLTRIHKYSLTPSPIPYTDGRTTGPPRRPGDYSTVSYIRMYTPAHTRHKNHDGGHEDHHQPSPPTTESVSLEGLVGPSTLTRDGHVFSLLLYSKGRPGVKNRTVGTPKHRSYTSTFLT